MPAVEFEQPDGQIREVDIAIGQSLMRAAIENGVVGIDAECGGACSCATCHVYVDDGAQIMPPDDVENEMLDGVAAERRHNSRLSCQLVMTAEMAGMRVVISPAQY